MDTNSQQFQEALQNLTTAFFQFLRVVNPSGITREADIIYITQSLQAIASRMGNNTSADVPAQSVSSDTKQTTNVDPTPIATPSVEQPVVSPVLPDQPNLFREQPWFDKRTGVWGFDRPRPFDGDSKLFRLYTNGNEGEFEMKPVSAENWQVVYEGKDKILPPEVVTIEGEMAPSAQSEPTGRGKIRKEGNLWRVVQPCHIQITSA